MNVQEIEKGMTVKIQGHPQKNCNGTFFVYNISTLIHMNKAGKMVNKSNMINFDFSHMQTAIDLGLVSIV